MALTYNPSQTYFGGSAGALDRTRSQFEQGRQQGLDATGRVLGMGSMLNNNFRAETGALTRTGQSLAHGQQYKIQEALWHLGRTAGQVRQIADTNTSSVAVAQQQAANNQLARALTAQASTARGGNQAAAMRNAQAFASAHALQTNQQLAQLRAQEEQARVARQMQAAGLGMQVGSQMLGAAQQQQQLGLDTQFKALQAAQAEQQRATQAALGVGQLGLGQQQLYTGAGLTANQAQLQADLEYQRQQQQAAAQNAAFAGQLLGTAGSVVGGFMG